MTDAATPVVLTNVVNTSVTGVGVVIFGMHTGLDYPTLLAGIFGGAFALQYLEKAGLAKRAFEVVSAAIIAGYFSPVVAGIVLHNLLKFDLIKDAADTKTGLQLSLAAVIGYVAHGVIFPGMLKLGKSYMRRMNNE